MRTFCLFRTYFHEGTNHMEKKTIALSIMALVHFSYHADPAAAKVVRKRSVPHGLGANKFPFPFPFPFPLLLPTRLMGI